MICCCWIKMKYYLGKNFWKSTQSTDVLFSVIYVMPLLEPISRLWPGRQSWRKTLSPSQQRSVSVGNITDCDLTQPLCETRVPTHVSCDHLDKRHVSARVPPAPPPRLSSLQRAPSQALMYYTTVPQSLITRNLGSRHQPTRLSDIEIGSHVDFYCFNMVLSRQMDWLGVCLEFNSISI